MSTNARSNQGVSENNGDESSDDSIASSRLPFHSASPSQKGDDDNIPYSLAGVSRVGESPFQFLRSRSMGNTDDNVFSFLWVMWLVLLAGVSRAKLFVFTQMEKAGVSIVEVTTLKTYSTMAERLRELVRDLAHLIGHVPKPPTQQPTGLPTVGSKGRKAAWGGYFPSDWVREPVEDVNRASCLWTVCSYIIKFPSFVFECLGILFRQHAVSPPRRSKNLVSTLRDNNPLLFANCSRGTYWMGIPPRNYDVVRPFSQGNRVSSLGHLLTPRIRTSINSGRLGLGRAPCRDYRGAFELNPLGQRTDHVEHHVEFNTFLDDYFNLDFRSFVGFRPTVLWQVLTELELAHSRVVEQCEIRGILTPELMSRLDDHCATFQLLLQENSHLYDRSLPSIYDSDDDEPQVTVGMINNRVINAGAARRGGNQRGPFPAGDPRHVPPLAALRAAMLAGPRVNIPAPPPPVVPPAAAPAPVAPNPPPPVPPAPPAGPVEVPLPAWNGQWKKYESEFIHSDFPQTKCLFKQSELGAYSSDSVLLDPLGDPFCGMTAIDLAVGVLPKVDVYLKRCKYMATVFDLGQNQELRKWAHFRGVNLRIIVPLAPDGHVGRAPVERHADYMNNQAWNWVILVVKDSNGRVIVDIDPDEVYHAFLVVDEASNRPNLVLPDEPTPIIPWAAILINFLLSWATAKCLVWILIIVGLVFFGDCVDSANTFFRTLSGFLMGAYGWRSGFHALKDVYLLDCGGKFSEWTYLLPWLDELLFVILNFRYIFYIRYRWIFLGYSYNKCDYDLRTIRSRRDKLESQDYYGQFVEVPCLHIFDFVVFKFFRLGFERYRFVSVTRAVQLLSEIQLIDEEDLSVSLVSLLKANYANTDDSHGTVYRDTRDYVMYYARQLKILRGAVSNRTVLTTGYSAQGSAAYIGNLTIVGLNQFSINVGFSVGKTIDGIYHLFNHGMFSNGFKSLAVSKLKPVPKKIVSYAPAGSLVTDCGQVGPGNMCTTEPCSLFAALAGRSMVKLPIEGLEDFKEFAIQEIKRLVLTVDSTGVVIDKDVKRCFEKINRGKRTAKYISRRLRMYDDFVERGLKNRKFFKNSCFVKFEDSSKIVGGECRVRPRLIMTMSDYSSVALSPIIQLIDLWNHSAFGKYQIKGCDPSTFNSRIAEFCMKEHIVTDYSAFESSVSGTFKECEEVLVHELCRKFDCLELLRQFKRLTVFKRELSCEIGTFLISSRCSGDYTTSTFNCLVNYLINAYSAKSKGLDHTNLHLLVEGDDGLTKPEQMDVDLINSIGFEFSANTAGSKPGDVDFLRKRWAHEGTMVSIGRTLKNLFWVNSKQKLSLSKQKAILRAKALSYNCVSPGHPVISSAINFILEFTAGHNAFKGIDLHLNNNLNYVFLQGFNTSDLGKKASEYYVNERLRGMVADGAHGFPPLPMPAQLVLERQFLKGKFYVSSLLNDYDEIIQANINKEWTTEQLRETSKEIAECIKVVTMHPIEFAQTCPDAPLAPEYVRRMKYKAVAVR